MSFPSILKNISVLSLSAMLAIPTSAVDETAFIEALQDCLNPYAGSCSALKSMRNELRGLRPDGSFEYYRWEKQGKRTNSSSNNVDTDRGTYTVHYRKGAVANHIYRVGFIVPENRGAGIDNATFTLKSYRIKYTPVPTGKGEEDPIVLEKSPNKVLKPKESFFVDLKQVAKTITIEASVSHKGTKRSWRSLGLNPDPNFDIKVVYATQLDDPANPNSSLLKMALNPSRSQLRTFGVPSHEIPPEKVRFGFQKPFFGSEQLADEAKSVARTAASMRSSEGMVDMLYRLKRIGGPRDFNRRIDEILDYVEPKRAQQSMVSRAYAKAMIDELADLPYYYPAPRDPDLKPGYGGVEDPAGDWGDRPVDPNPAGNWDEKPGSNPAGDWDSGGSGSSGYGSDPAGDWGDKPSGASNNSVETPLGSRKYDSIRQGIAIDIKSGRISKSSSIEDQIRKDGFVVRTSRNGIRRVIWRFKPRNGKCGPTDSVKTLMIRENVGIDDSQCSKSGSGFYNDSGLDDDPAGKW